MKTTELKNIKGYTLVEVMVATLITFIVLGGVYQTITRETIDMDQQESILDMQNNARAAIDRITREIRRAGFLGCGGDLATGTLVGDGDVTATIGALTAGTGWDGNTSILTTLLGMGGGSDINYLGTPLGYFDNAASDHGIYAPGTDALSLVYLAGDVALDTAMAISTDPLDLATSAFDKGDILLITDCKDAALLQKTNCSDTLLVRHTIADACPGEPPALNPLNSGTDLGKDYGNEAPARVYSVKISTYFLEKGTNELCYNTKDLAIAANIEDLQFELLFDENNNKDLTDDAWRSSFPTGFTAFDVRAIRVWILAMSDVVNSYTNTETYDYPDSLYPAGSPPNDHRYRYLAASAVYLRNSGI